MRVCMEDVYEEILAELTETQRNLLTTYVRSGMRPNDALDSDIEVLLRRELFESPFVGEHKEDYSGFRESRKVYGPPAPSDFGREWVAWYLTRLQRNRAVLSC